MRSDLSGRLLPALFVCVIWGVNFSAIEEAAATFPPMLLAFLRFLLCVVPVILFVRRPAVATRWIVGYGLTFGLLQFAFLFAGVSQGAGAGASSFLLQSQAFFTVLLSVLVLNERLAGHQAYGLVIGLAGVAVIVLAHGDDVTWVGGALVVTAGLAWGLANLIVKVSKPEDTFAFIVYAGAVALLPFLALTLIFEGPQRIRAAFDEASWAAYLSLLYLVYPTTLIGYSIWNRLLRTYPAISVAPFALLIPVVGVATAIIWHGESVNTMQSVGFVTILLGLVICQYWHVITASSRLKRRKRVHHASS